MAETTTETQDPTARESSGIERQESEPVLHPAVDICEDAEGITLLVDMPGVSKERLNLQVDKDSLIVEGHASIDIPEDMEALYADVRSTRYRRSFALSGELETEGIEAKLTHGVLRVRIPKSASARPRKIEVHTE